jgi:hypothetical protein
VGTPNYPRDFGTTLTEMRRLATAAFSSGNARAALRKILAQTFTVAGDLIVQGGGRILAYAADSTEIVNINTADGTVSIVGQLSSGVAGDRVVVNPTGSPLPEIRWYPATPSDLYTVVNARSDLFTGEATLQVLGGVDPATGNGTTRRWMSNGLIRDSVLAADQTIAGGHLDVAAGYIDYGMYVGPIASSVYRLGGRFHGEPTYGEVGYWDNGANDCRWSFRGDAGGRADLYGVMPNYSDLGAGNCLFTGSVAGTASAASISIGYGTTAASLRQPLVTVFDTGAKSSVCSAASTTSFTVDINPAANGSWFLIFMCFRTP